MTTITADPTTQLAALKDTDNAELRQEVTLKLADVQALSVTDAKTYAIAGQHYIALGALEKRIVSWWEPLTSAADKLHKALTGRRAEMVKDLKAERDRLSREMSVWKMEQDRQTAERERQAALEEKKRQDAIAAEQASLLELQGQPELAAAVIQQAIETPAPAVSLAPTVPRVEGLTAIEEWNFRILDVALIPRAYLMPDLKAIGKVVDALKGATRIPGVEVYRDDRFRRTGR